MGLISSVVFLCATLSVKAAYRVELVTDEVSRPVFVCAPPGDTNRLFIVEQHSRLIRIFNRVTGTLNEIPFLQTPGVRTGNEQGLLGLAFHPGYRTNGYFFINLTPSGGSARTEVLRYTASGDPATSDIAEPGSRKLIVTFVQPESNHNGGWMGFGPDGYLYISSGDGGGGNDQHPPAGLGNAQNRASLLGKILRLDVDGGDPYAIPDGNPFKDHATFAEEIWAFGLRNPWRCSIDSETGDLWIGDVGQGAREEIDVVPSGVGGLNFGWRPREGAIQNPSFPNETPVTAAVDPVTDYPRSMGYSVTGGYLYRGSAIPELRGKYIFADYGSARFWTITPDASGTNGARQEVTAEVNPSPRVVSDVSSFGEDAEGELYICDLDGAVFKIVPEGPIAPSVQISAGEDEFVIHFEAVGGQEYTLEQRDSLTAGSAWSTAQTIPSDANNRNVSITNSVSGTEQYFRLRSN